jgi:glycosyltransferase involved in cell wall biosynthesis
MSKILWLTSWYPNLTDPFNGDFIKREAEAVSVSLLTGTNYSDVHNKHEALEEYVIYYSSAGDRSVLSRFRSLKVYFKRHLEFIKRLRKDNELPDLVHVQVALKAGLIALYLKWRHGIPYILTEHWSGYYPVSKDSLYKKSFLTRFATRLIIQRASRFLPVSEDLGKEISKHWTPVSFQKIPNVVNTELFYPSHNAEATVFRFIHISSLQYPKNPEGIIRAFIALLKQHIPAELELVGPVSLALSEFIKASGLQPDQLHCTGEISYDQVAVELRKSSSLVMFSYYENMPCAILEALCTGLPVIATKVGGIPEIIRKENGILINVGKETELVNAMKEMIRNQHMYDRGQISRDAREQFSYEVIGKKIVDTYRSVLENK